MAAARRVAEELGGTSGFEVPRWAVLQDGLRPPLREADHHQPGGTRVGWQHEAASRVERQFCTEVLLPHMSSAAKGNVEVSERTSRRRAVFHCTIVTVDLHRACPLQSAPVAPPVSSFTPDCSQLSVWPSPRRFWPPPDSLLTVGGVGPERVCS